MTDLARLINSGKLINNTVRTSANTTPTSYEEFVHTFVYVYNM